MTTQYHQRTLALLLDNANEIRDASTAGLTAWAAANRIALPGAYLEWARLGGADVLERYSNTDSFFFEQPEISDTPENARGLVFQRENQGNFDKMVVLDGSEDPPVLFACIGKPPWVRYAPKFSDAIFAQIFDWQYMVENYYGDLRLRTEHCIGVLQQQCEQHVTTRFVMDGQCTTEYRFSKSLRERITLGIREDETEACREGKAYLVITGDPELVKPLEAQLMETFGDDVIPDAFSFLRMAASELERAIVHRGVTQTRYLMLERPTLDIVDRLAMCHRKQPLMERVGNDDFPRSGSTFALGGPDWGVRLQFRRKTANWWWLERAEIA